MKNPLPKVKEFIVKHKTKMLVGGLLVASSAVVVSETRVRAMMHFIEEKGHLEEYDSWLGFEEE